jgi:hypothetical protein
MKTMSVLMQCPHCGFTHLRAPALAGEMVTCSRCKKDYAYVPAPPAASQPGDESLESEPVYEVDFIEVLDEVPPAQSPPAPAPLALPIAELEASSPFAAAAMGPWELAPNPPPPAPAAPFDEVEIIAPPPLPAARHGPAVKRAEVIDEDIPIAMPIAEPVVDHVEVVDETTPQDKQ